MSVAVRAGLLVLAGVVAGAVLGASTSVLWFAPVAVVALALLGWAAWRTPVVAAVLVVAFVPALSGLSRGLVVPGLKLSEALLLVGVAALLLSRPRRWRAGSGVDLALVVLAAVGLGFAVHHSGSGLGSVLRIGLQPTFLLMTWWAASRGVERAGDLRVVLRWMLLVSLVPAALAVLQSLQVPGLGDLLINLTADGILTEESRGATTRATGPFPIWHSLGGYLLVPVVLAAVLVLRGDRRVLPRPLLLLVLLVDLAALVLAVTVTLLIWLPVAFLVAAALAGAFRRGVAIAVVLAVASLAAFPSVLLERVDEQQTQSRYTQGGVLPQTLEYRILVWERDYLPLLDDAAVAGLGNDPPPDVAFASTENQYITYALRGGVVLVLAAVVVMAALAGRSWRLARAPDAGHPDGPDLSVARSSAMAVFGIVAFLPVALMIWPYLSNAGLQQALFAFAGASLALEPRRRSRFATTRPGAPASHRSPVAPERV